MTESSLRPWLAALAFSLSAHLALGFGLHLMPPMADRGPATHLTVSFIAATSDDGSNPQEQESVPAEHPRQKPPPASPVPTHEAPKASPVNQTVPTEPKPRNASPQRAAVELREAPPPKPAAKPQPKPDRPALEPPSRPPSAPHAAGSAAAAAMTPTPARAAIAPVQPGVGDPGDTDADLRAARPAPGNPKPHYPALARRRGYEGHVLIQAGIQADGRTGQVEVKQSSGHRVLDEAAVATVKDWRFLPARRAGQAVSTTVDIPIRFRLDDEGR
ncbi:MAG: energy transducer TonB [Gammaproteobacteria bacterium]